MVGFPVFHLFDSIQCSGYSEKNDKKLAIPTSVIVTASAQQCTLGMQIKIVSSDNQMILDVHQELFIHCNVPKY